MNSFKVEVTYICFNEIKGKFFFTPYYLPDIWIFFKKILNFVYKSKKQKVRKVVWWNVLKWHIFNKGKLTKLAANMWIHYKDLTLMPIMNYTYKM